jgi:hypothetical protein
MIMEIWKDIKGYEGLYQVSNFGNVKRILFINNICSKQKEKLLKININKFGRCLVHLYKNNIRKAKQVHRLVATAFIDNPKNLPQINHLDGNPQNNNITNLEWCTAKENMKHSYHSGLNKIREYNNQNKKSIIRNDGVIYDCAYNASKDLKVSVSSIRDCLKGRSKTCKGFTFRYV